MACRNPWSAENAPDPVGWGLRGARADCVRLVGPRPPNAVLDNLRAVEILFTWLTPARRWAAFDPGVLGVLCDVEFRRRAEEAVID